jgi:hypothetical protein
MLHHLGDAAILYQTFLPLNLLCQSLEGLGLESLLWPIPTWHAFDGPHHLIPFIQQVSQNRAENSSSSPSSLLIAVFRGAVVAKGVIAEATPVDMM